jgi:hypothetical protein
MGRFRVSWLLAFGRSIFTAWLIAGIVTRKMISRTSMTSTSGVMLISLIMPSSSSLEKGLIAI